MAEFAQNLMSQNIWFQAAQYHAAEVKLLQHQMGISAGGDSAAATPAPVRKAEPKSKASNMMADLKDELAAASSGAVNEIGQLLDRVCKLEAENASVKATLEKALAKLDLLESKFEEAPKEAPKEEAPKEEAKPAAKEESEDDDDDDMDFFGSSDEEEDAEAERVKAERVAAYNARKAAKAEVKGAVIAKSSITLEVKPWDDETDLGEVEKMVRDISMDGLVWGTSKLKPVGYGIMKLSIICVVEDDKVGSDDLIETIEGFEDHVQSVDIAAFNKI